MRRVTAYTTNYWDSALGVLRLAGPARFAGIELVRGNEPGTGEIWPERVSDGEAVVIQRDFARWTEPYRQVVDRARWEGKAVIFDLDDLLLELPEGHPDRDSRYYSEAVLPMALALAEADLITVSSAALAGYVAGFNPNVWLLPNYLDDGLWKLRTPRLGAGEGLLVLGYMGGDSHLPDLEAITPALVRVLRRYEGQVQLQVLGVQPPAELFERPNVDWSPAASYQYPQFAADFLSRELDVCIAPLRENDFNRCKSAVKFLEYSAAGAAGVFARLDPYESVVRHGENGFLAGELEEWESCLCALIENPELRMRLALEAQETVRRDWLLSEHARGWAEAWARPPDPEERARFLAANSPLERFLRLAREGQAWQEHERGQFQELSGRAHRQEALLREQAERLEGLESQVEELGQSLAERGERLAEADRALYALYNSDAYRLMEAVAAPGSRRGGGR